MRKAQDEGMDTLLGHVKDEVTDDKTLTEQRASKCFASFLVTSNRRVNYQFPFDYSD